MTDLISRPRYITLMAIFLLPTGSNYVMLPKHIGKFTFLIYKKIKLFFFVQNSIKCKQTLPLQSSKDRAAFCNGILLSLQIFNFYIS